MSDDENERRQSELKPLTDLWIHHNNLMWGRLNTLILMQGGLLAVGYTLRSHTLLTMVICGMLIILTSGLWIFSLSDRKNRDSYRVELNSLGFYIRRELAFGLKPSSLFWHSKEGLRFGQSRAELYMTFVFFIAELVDVAALFVFPSLPPNLGHPAG